MMHFDFLRDERPALVERLGSLAMPPRLKTPLAVLATVVLVVCGWFVVEQRWLSQALREDRTAQARFAQSRRELALAQVQASDVTRLVALDRRLIEMRRSGRVLANRLVEIGDAIPRGAWLTELDDDGRTIALGGSANGFDTLGSAISGLLATRSARRGVRLVHADRADARSAPGTLAFRLRAGALR